MDPSFGVNIGAYTNHVATGEMARLAERSRFDSVWVPEYKLYGDVYVALAVCARMTRRVKLGPATTCPFVRHPASIASSISTIQELSKGRAVLALGPGGMIIHFLAIDTSNVIASMREATLIIRNLLTGTGRSFDGQHFKLKRPRLDLAVKGKIPIYLAATGEKMLKLGGEVGDGVFINVGIHPDSLKYAIGKIEEGAKAAGRKLSDIEPVCWVQGCQISRDPAKAKEKVKTSAAIVLAHLPSWLRVKLGLTEEERGKIFEACHRERFDQLPQLIPNEVIDRFTLAGDADEVSERVGEILKVGINTIVLIPSETPGREISEGIAAFDKHVISRFASRR